MKIFTQPTLLATISDLVAEIARTDNQLEATVLDGKPVGQDWAPKFDRAAASVMDVRDGLLQLRPEATAELAALRFETIDLAHDAGLLEASFRQGNKLTAAWGDVLDSTLVALRAATQVLAAPAPVKVGPVKQSGPAKG